jgi:hypothetical protein
MLLQAEHQKAAFRETATQFVLHPLSVLQSIAI